MEHPPEKNTTANHQDKAEDVVRSFIRNTSCNRGWLKFFVQLVFATLTVSSFIMIMLSVLRNSGRSSPSTALDRPCVTNNCRVTCSSVIIPLHNVFIYEALENTDSSCNNTGISLFFHRPAFPKETIPLNWLSMVNVKVIELVITSGNLEIIPPDSFMTNFAQNLKILTLEDLNLKVLESNMFVGLSSLQELNIRDCRIKSIHRNALRAVDETLKILQVKSSGAFDPANLTGSSELQRLTHVDLTLNRFGNILNSHSFKELKSCKILNLGSSGITSIGRAAFDNLENIEKLYLNNNCLTTINPELFVRLISMSVENSPKIDLQHNRWDCICRLDHLKRLQRDGFLIGDPVCHNPSHFRGRPFSSIRSFCEENKYASINTTDVSAIDKNRCIEVEELYQHTRNTVFMEGFCNNTEANKLIPYKCPRQNYEYLNIEELRNIYDAARFRSKVLSSVFFIYSPSTSVMEIQTTMVPGHDLIWFSMNNPEDVFCVNALPKYLRLYNVDENTVYVFCPINQITRSITTNSCITYVPAHFDNPHFEDTEWPQVTRGYIRLIIYIILLALSLITGASLVYVTVLKYPTLLKANKRVLVVKHKNVDALVLPPKVYLRNEDCKTSQEPIGDGSFDADKLKLPYFVRNASNRSSKSNAPSYVSAAQPTQAQLAAWRLRYHFDKAAASAPDADADLNTISWIYGNDPLYHSITACEDPERRQAFDGDAPKSQ
ncbi:Reticulon-4 receptor-like 2 [Eumeta japonica]|uniref:Reticulon-4 receptor-like 2 n=1 Tax=Eumeta variegata TaxID=151549 RepID=A0A4C1UF56_EUMVA|nr:Reticulon-4 receptor-like 2 [Eumeta japonica]